MAALREDLSCGQVRRWSGQRCAKLVAAPPRGLLHLVGRKLNASREQAELLITCYFAA